MPIEIKELHIKAIVNNNNQQNPFNYDWHKEKAKMKKEMIKECLEHLNELIENKTER